MHEQVYHISCFKCHVCKKELQGKAFFAVQGQPYCEEDYLVSFPSLFIASPDSTNHTELSH